MTFTFNQCSFLYEHFALLSGLLSQSVMLSLFDMTVVCFCCLFYRGHLLYQMCPPKVNLLLFLWEAADWCINKISMFIFPFQVVFKLHLLFCFIFLVNSVQSDTVGVLWRIFRFNKSARRRGFHHISGVFFHFIHFCHNESSPGRRYYFQKTHMIYAFFFSPLALSG